MRWIKTYNGTRISFDNVEQFMITNLCSIGWVEYCNSRAEALDAIPNGIANRFHHNW